MKIVIDNPIAADLDEADQSFMHTNTIFFDAKGIQPQKCSLPEESIWQFLYILESYGYGVDLTMYSVGRFKLEVY